MSRASSKWQDAGIRCPDSLTDLFKGHARHPVCRITSRETERWDKQRKNLRGEGTIRFRRLTVHHYIDTSHILTWTLGSLKKSTFSRKWRQCSHWTGIRRFSFNTFVEMNLTHFGVRTKTLVQSKKLKASVSFSFFPLFNTFPVLLLYFFQETYLYSL